MQKAEFQITFAVKTTLKSESKRHKNDLHEYFHYSVYILWNCELNLSSILLGILDQFHERAVGIITKTNPVKLTPIQNYEQGHTCQIVRTTITRQPPAPTTNYFKPLSHLKSTRNSKLSIALPRVRAKTAQNGFYYQGAMIYKKSYSYVRK